VAKASVTEAVQSAGEATREERSLEVLRTVALVSMLGEGANWVRNVRAAGGEVALCHGPREEVHLQEVVAPDLRAPVLKAYLKRATNASVHMPIDKDAPLASFERLAPSFTVFRIVPRSEA
jgi:hypothetical protein